MTISFNPYLTNQPQNSFLQETQGYIQGLASDDPSSKNWLASGILATSETLPMWGGVPVSEFVNLLGTNAEALGPTVARATAAPGTSAGAATGIAVFNQAAHMVITPGNTVPLASVSNGVNFYRFGTNARVAVQCDPALLTTLQSANEAISQPALFWDTTNFRITLTTTGNFALTGVKLLSINTNSKIVSWNGSVASWSAGTAALIQL
jgi:hypothetical protein